jgi:hypothetical protein
VLGIQGGEDIAQMIMRRRARVKRSEPAQQGELLVAEAGDVGDGFRSGQHRKQAQQQHLSQGVHHLAALPRVRQVFEMAQEDNRLRDRLIITGRHIHRNHPLANQRISTDSALQPLVTR